MTTQDNIDCNQELKVNQLVYLYLIGLKWTILFWK